MCNCGKPGYATPVLYGTQQYAGQDPSDSKSNQLHVDIIFRFCFYLFRVYSIDSSKMVGNIPQPVISQTHAPITPTFLFGSSHEIGGDYVQK